MESYTTIEGHQNYPPQGGVYANSENYDAGASFHDDDERPPLWPPSIAGVSICSSIFFKEKSDLLAFRS